MGLGAWLVLAVAAASGAGDLSLALLVVLLAPLVVVPLSVPLVAPGTSTRAMWALRAGAVAATASAMPRPGALAGVLASCWLLASLTVAVPAALASWSDRSWWPERLLPVVALGWLPAAAAWLVASRTGFSPFGFDEPITIMTSAHFHFAGHATTVITATVLAHMPPTGIVMRRVALAAATCTTLGPVFVAAGWQTGEGVLHVVGAVLLTSGIAALVPCTFSATACRRPHIAVVAARVSAFAPALPLTFAMLYSLGRITGIASPSIEFMVRAHGAVNAIGFAALTLASWRAITSTEPARRHTTARDAKVGDHAAASR